MSDQSKMVPIPGLTIVRADYKTNLQYYRNLRRISQVALSERAQVNLRTLQDYEQGQKSINNARAGTVARLADALGVPIQDLLEPLD